MSDKTKKELEKNKKIKELEDSREDKFLEFIGGKIILYILTIVILLGIAIYLYTEISYIFTPINAIVSSIITPIILAYVFYYILNPLVNLFSKKLPRFASSLLAMLVGLVVILVVIIGMVPIIVEQTQTLIISIPKYIEMVKNYLDSYSDNAYMQVVIEYINNTRINKIVSNAIHINKLSIIILLKYLKISIIRDQNKKKSPIFTFKFFIYFFEL